MKRFRDISLSRKLTSIMTLASMLVLVVAMLVFSVYEYVSFRRGMRTHIEGLAAVLTANLSTAITFEDRASATATLEALGTSDIVKAARLYKADGTVFATYERAGFEIDFPRLPELESTHVEHNRITLYRPVILAGDRVGILLLHAQWQALAVHFDKYATPFVVILLISLVVSVLLSLSLRRVISQPILELAESMKLVSYRKNYDVRAEKTANDEVGVLIDGFNLMLDEIGDHQEELNRSRGRLEELVRQRTTEQAHANKELKSVVEQLKDAKDAAVTANRTKSQFLARMSHEIRTPMNGVLGMTDLLMHSRLTDRQKHLAETVYRSGEALLHIINDILDFSKIESGKLDLDCTEFTIRTLLDEALELMGERAQKKGLELLGFVDDAVPIRMFGDPLRLRQIVINLVGNAIKFTKNGQVTVHIQSLHEANNNVILKFEIKDSGIGIRDEARQRIFDPFSQADGSTTRQYGGTGLGLAICKQLALMMGGDIGVDSEQGKGSNFWFTATFTQPAHAVRDHVASRDAFQGCPMLLVASQPALQEWIKHRLTTWEVDLDTVGSSEEGMLKVRANAAAGAPYHVVLVDAGLAGTDAWALAQQVRADEKIQATRMLALIPMTADAAFQIEDSGFDDGVRKPIREDELYAAIAEVLGRRVPRDMPERLHSRLAHEGMGAQFNARILVAEDNVVNQEVARGMLMSMGCEVTMANNGLEAVEYIKDQVFDLVLMDCQMPEMDGFDATRAIKKFFRNEEGSFFEGTAHGPVSLPIVALTANAMEGDREMCITRGMDDYMSKPFTLRQLEELLLRWIPDLQAMDENHPPLDNPRAEVGSPSTLTSATTGQPARPSSEMSGADDQPTPPPSNSPAEPVKDKAGMPPGRADTGAPSPFPALEIQLTAPPAIVDSMAEPAAKPPAILAKKDVDPLDRKILDSIIDVQVRGGVSDLLERVINSYLEETPKLLQQLREASEKADPHRLRKGAHALKSSSANVGARAVVTSCKSVEQMDDEALLTGREDLIARAEADFVVVGKALKELMEKVSLS